MDKQPYHINCPHCGYRIGDGYAQRMPDGKWHVTVTMSSISTSATTTNSDRDAPADGNAGHGKT